MFWIMACIAAGERSWTEAGPFEAVEVEARNGDVSLVAEAREDAHIDWSGGALGPGAEPTVEVVDGVLRVDSACEGLCGGELVLAVPQGVQLAVWLDAGSARLELGAAADVCIDVDTGSAELEVPAGGWRLDLEVGAGSLELDGVWEDSAAEHEISGSILAGSVEIHGRELAEVAGE